MHLDDPLSDKEFNELDQFLLSDRCADDGMTMDSLHGYLTALIIGPEEVTMAEWLPPIWGAFAEQGPRFDNEKQAQRIIGLITRFRNEIAMIFEVAPKEFEPLFCQREWEGHTIIDGDGWAWGFWEGVILHPDAWAPIWSPNIVDLLRPFYFLGADEVEPDDDDEREKLEELEDPVIRGKLAIEMEAAIPEIRKFWLSRQKSPVAQVQRDEPKVGRNDSCPCGSGKKYKKCCGAE